MRHRSISSIISSTCQSNRPLLSKTFSLIAVLVCLCSVAYADKKDRDWLTGLDTDRAGVTTYGGTNTQGQVNADGTYSGQTTQSSWHTVHETFVIQGDVYGYVVSHILRFRWSKETKLTVNAQVKYVLEKDQLILLDDKGREFKMHIDKTILRKDAAAKDAQTGKTTAIVDQPATRAETPDYSIVVIKSLPDGAEITIDDKFIGTTSSTIRLPSGEHTISITKSGFKPWQRTITVSAGGNITTEATLEKIP